ncbi:MAG: RagB/SusD family nutrient uptake outer membrane protein [Bacteroidota bacterium]
MFRNFYSKVVVALSLIVVVSACDDPEQELFSELNQDAVLSSTDPDVLAVLAAGAYTPIIGAWGGHNSIWSLHEVSSDEMVIAQKGADWEDGGQWIRVHRHQYNPEEESVQNGWDYCFGAIGTINNLINQFAGNDALVAEFKALRGLVYLWLLDAYGNVPIITEESDDSTPEASPRAEVFAFVESSLLENIDALERSATYARMNYYVARTALAKLYLNADIYTGTTNLPGGGTARWNDVIAQADSVLDAGLYSLEANFLDNFATINNTSENIFVLNYDTDNAGGFNLPQMTLHYQSEFTYDLQEQPWNGYASLQAFYESFDQNDERINSFLVGPQFDLDGEQLNDLSAEDDDPNGQPIEFTPEINELTPNSLRQAGARVGKFEFALGSGQSLSNDFPIFRLADVYLMKAEALWRLDNGSGEALELVNMMRTRAGVSPLTGLTADELLAERGREFFAEGWRRSDLIRFGKFNDPWWEKEMSSADKNIFPIPQSARDNNPSLAQNPGYSEGG